jgi:hypothetical protein
VANFDASRPVPWGRLLRLFLVYAVIANVIFFVFFRDDFGAGALVGTVMGGTAYLVISYVLVKFGWDPPMLRARANAREAAERASTPATPTRPAAGGTKPAPTKRTNATNPKARRR